MASNDIPTVGQHNKNTQYGELELPGEANVAANIGGGAEVYSDKEGDEQFVTSRFCLQTI